MWRQQTERPRNVDQTMPTNVKYQGPLDDISSKQCVSKYNNWQIGTMWCWNFLLDSNINSDLNSNFELENDAPGL